MTRVRASGNLARVLAVACVAIVLAATAGCSPAQSIPDEDPAIVARAFVEAVVSDDAAAATAVSATRLNQADLAGIREKWTGSREVDVVIKADLVAAAVAPTNAIVGFEWLETDSGIDSDAFNEAGHTLDLEPHGQGWLVRGVY